MRLGQFCGPSFCGLFEAFGAFFFCVFFANFLRLFWAHELRAKEIPKIAVAEAKWHSAGGHFCLGVDRFFLVGCSPLSDRRVVSVWWVGHFCLTAWSLPSVWGLVASVWWAGHFFLSGWPFLSGGLLTSVLTSGYSMCYRNMENLQKLVKVS